MTRPDDALLRELLRLYMELYPAFRLKPVGAPGSQMRARHDHAIVLEDRARAALAAAEEEG